MLKQPVRNADRLRWDWYVVEMDDFQVQVSGTCIILMILCAYLLDCGIFRNPQNFIVVDVDRLLKTAHLY
jgi:hypothetical protein